MKKVIQLADHSEIVKRAEALADELIHWRRHLHMHPELSYQEYETSKFVAEKLKQIEGMEVETGIAGTGVVGTLSSGDGPAFAIRADMDALPIDEKGDQDYCSKNRGVMHACGHDAHTAILLGVAQLLGESFYKNEISGTMTFLFQPAEEVPDENGLTGASHVMNKGVLNDVDAVIALHMCPWRKAGQAQLNAGYSMANIDVFQATIRGSGGHGAYPHLCRDPIWMLGPTLQALYGIISRKVSPLESGVVSIGQIHAGASSNVIPAEVEIEGTLRSYKPEVREFLVDEIKKAFSVTQSLGGDYSIEVMRGEPALKNNPQVNKWLAETIRSIYPSFQIKEGPFGLGGEDFSLITKNVPGAMFFLGCKMPDGKQRDLHTPEFDIDESCLPCGVAILAETARRYLKGEISMNNQNNMEVSTDGS